MANTKIEISKNSILYGFAYVSIGLLLEWLYAIFEQFTLAAFVSVFCTLNHVVMHNLIFTMSSL